MKGFLRLFLITLLGGIVAHAQAACLAVCSKGDPSPTLKAHTCCSLCLGTCTSTEKAHVAYNGFTLGLAHASMADADVMRVFYPEQCDFNGATVQLFSQINNGTVRGFSLTGLIALQRDIRGVQLSGLANDSHEVKGVQLALGVNRAKACRGLQFGLFNIAGDLTGVQVGLLNINADGLILPLINVSW